MQHHGSYADIIIIIIIIIKNEKIRVTLCENAAGALYIVNKVLSYLRGRICSAESDNTLFIDKDRCYCSVCSACDSYNSSLVIFMGVIILCYIYIYGIYTYRHNCALID